MKMPEPTMPPITTIVASNGPSARRKPTRGVYAISFSVAFSALNVLLFKPLELSRCRGFDPMFALRVV